MRPPIIIDLPILYNNSLESLPDVSLSSMFPDLNLTAFSNVYELNIENEEGIMILHEAYKSYNLQYVIKGLKEILSMYLRRKNKELVIGGQNTQIIEKFHFYSETDTDEEKYCDVIYSRQKSNIPAEKFKGDLFLTTQYLKKVTTPGGKEFLTYFFKNVGVQVSVRMYYQIGKVIMNTPYVPIEGGQTGFYAFDTSFSRVKSYFPNIDSANCLFYRVGNDTYNVEYLIDRSSYPNFTQLVYMNNFGVPETLYIRGEVIQHVAATFDEGKVHRISQKWNVKENETFEASTGKIFLRDEYLMWRDLFMSPDVYIYVNGTPRKVFVTESKNSINRLKGINTSLKFTFRFADENDTWDYMRYIEWILEHGVWDDQGIWADTGHWLDVPG